MKKYIFILLLCSICMSGWGQENGVFVSAGLGTKVCDKAFHGADISMQTGYNYKGLDISAQLDYFSNFWGANDINVRTVESYAGMDATMHALSNTDKDRENISHLTIRLNLGYDVLRFIRGNWRHHVRPYVGIGYSQARESSNSTTHTSLMRTFTWKEQTQSGFELTLGIAYDFNITHHWAVGAFIEENALIREQPIMGLRTRYSF